MKKFFIKLFLFNAILIVLFFSCHSTPIILRPIPTIDLSDDLTIHEYLNNSTVWGVEITAYIKELINQIKHKTNYIELKE